MRCQKCGYISFDGRLTCSRCGKAFQDLDGLAGTAIDAEPPDYLVARREEEDKVEEPSFPERVTVATETVPAGQAAENPQGGDAEFIAADIAAIGDSVPEETAAVPELFETVEQQGPESPDEKAGVVVLRDLSEDERLERADDGEELSVSDGITEISSFDDLLAGMEMDTPDIHSRPQADEQPPQDINDLNLELEQDRENEKS